MDPALSVLDEAWLYGTTRTVLGGADGITWLRLSERPSGTTWRALAAEGPARDLLAREWRLAGWLDPHWAVLPAAFIRRAQESVLVFADAGQAPLLAAGPAPIGSFLQQALGAAQALGRAHAAGLLLQVIGPGSLLADAQGRVSLSQFGYCSIAAAPKDPVPPACLQALPLAGLAPERLPPEPRRGDARSDLYALGCCLYALLTGVWPLQAQSLAAWRHAHIAIAPPPPSRHRRDIPAPLDQLLLKLLAKDPAERYQCAGTLSADLAQCLAGWRDGHIPPFRLGRLDAPWRQIVPSQLFGRGEEEAALAAAFTRVAATGAAELVLVAGAPGIGKSTLVRTLPGLTPAPLRAEGKSDQLNTSPYAPVVEALGTLVSRALSAGAAELAAVRARLQAQLEGQGQLLCDLVPAAALILGPCPAVPPLPALLAQARLQQTLRAAFAAFATAAAPLLLFIDDLQWADAPTLALLASLAATAPPHVLLVGAYRPQEAAPLLAPGGFVPAVRQAPLRLTEIALKKLTPAALLPFIATLLGCGEAEVAEISVAIHPRTGGNPFFVNQLLRSLFTEHALRYEPAGKGWVWEPSGLAASVGAFLQQRLLALPAPARHLLRQLACLGRCAPAALLASACDVSTAALATLAAPLQTAGLLTLADGLYAFAHDRVQEAAYALVPPAERPAAHAGLALLLLGLQDPPSRARIFEIAGQIEATDPAALPAPTRLAFAGALLRAAEQARAAGAVAQAAAYLGRARQMAEPGWWVAHYALCYRLHLLHADYLLAAAQTEAAAEALSLVLARARGPLDQAAAWQIQANLLTLRSDYEGAIEAALQGLAGLGITLRRGPDKAALDAAYAAVTRALAGRSIAALDNLPVMDDPAMRAAMGLLSTLISSIFLPDGLRVLHMAKMVELTLLYGVTADSAYGFSWFGVMAAYAFEAYEEGFAWAKAALALVERHGFEAQRTATLVALDQVCIWTQPMAYAQARIREAIAAGHKAGDVGMACYAHNHLISDLIVGGAPLAMVAEELGTALSFIRALGYRDIELLLEAQLGLVRALRADPQAPPPVPDEAGIVSRSTLFWVRLYAGIRAYFRGEMALALRLLDAADALSWAVPANIDAAYGRFFAGLAAAQVPGAPPPLAHHAAFVRLAALNPGMFANKALLLEAELAWRQGEPLRALRLCEASAQAAGAAGFVHERALAHERAAAFHAAAGLAQAAAAAAQAAQADYAAWGAFAKSGPPAAPPPEAPPGAAPGTAPLDLQVLMPALRALSEEIVPARVIDGLMTSMMIHAGADYGVLLLMHGETLRPEASARIADGQLVVRADGHGAAPVPAAILNTVLRTRQKLLIADTRLAPLDLAGTGAARAVLCLPLLKRGVLTGLVHLENRQAANVFTAERTTMIEILAAQAAISLETARLYTDLLGENTRRAQSEAALGRARAELTRTAHLTVMGELAASIVHEINQPLSAITTAAAASRRWLGRPEPDFREVLAGLASIQDGVTRANNIIRALRALARQTAATMAPTPIDALIRDVLCLIGSEFDSRQVRLQNNLRAPAAIVQADAVQLQQVVLNLVTNALEAMEATDPAARRLTVASLAAEGRVTIEISDTGPGIPETVSLRMFEPLFTTKETGMGMGLAICRSIMEAHGGTLHAAARPPGTMFSFSLALAAS